MEKVFAYLRVSSPAQAKDSKDGFPRQEQACRAYAKSHNMTVAEVYKEAFTGTEHSRPVMAELIDNLQQNHHGVKTVLIERLDRLARDYFVQEAIIRDFRAKGFTLISSNENEPDLCSDDPTRKLLRTFFGAIAEYDKNMTVARMRAARERKRAKGGKADGRYGYNDTEEGRALIRRIRALHRKPKYGRRRTLKEIAEMLNAEGTLTLNKRPWTISSVRDVIVNR